MYPAESPLPASDGQSYYGAITGFNAQRKFLAEARRLRLATASAGFATDVTRRYDFDLVARFAGALRAVFFAAVLRARFGASAGVVPTRLRARISRDL